MSSLIMKACLGIKKYRVRNELEQKLLRVYNYDIALNPSPLYLSSWVLNFKVENIF